MNSKNQDIKNNVITVGSKEYQTKPIALDSLTKSFINIKLFEHLEEDTVKTSEGMELFHLCIGDTLFIIDKTSFLTMDGYISHQKFWFIEPNSTMIKDIHTINVFIGSCVNLDCLAMRLTGCNYFIRSLVHAVCSVTLRNAVICDSIIKSQDLIINESSLYKCDTMSLYTTVTNSNVHHCRLTSKESIDIDNSSDLKELLIADEDDIDDKIDGYLNDDYKELLNREHHELIGIKCANTPKVLEKNIFYEYNYSLTTIYINTPIFVPFGDLEFDDLYGLKHKGRLDVKIKDRFDLSLITTMDRRVQLTAMRVNKTEMLLSDIHITKHDLESDYEALRCKIGNKIFHKNYPSVNGFNTIEILVLNDIMNSVKSRMSVYEKKTELGC